MRMSTRTLVAVGLALLALGGGSLLLLLPGGAPAPPRAAVLPWQVQANAEGSTTVFGLTLGRSTLAQARQRLGEDGELSLFSSRDGSRRSLEAYFDNVNLRGLRAKMVLTLRLPEVELAGLFDRGTRISSLSSGDKRITLRPEDLERARQLPVHSITYIPNLRLEGDTVRRRFGEPAERLVEDGQVTHWLYPDRGLDIALTPAGRTVFQYLLPSEFERVHRPLLQGRAAAAPTTPAR
jgi:hypothetical protein